MKRAYKVLNVHVHLVHSNPKSLVVCVIGSVGSSGWTQIQLSAWAYINPPVDGFYDFDLIGAPPSGIALDVMTPIATADAFPNPPASLKGVRIHAASNQLEAALDAGADFSFPDADIKLAGIFPWPDVDRKLS